MASRDLIVVGASAGGVEALQRLVAALPAALPAALLVVVHVPPRSPGLLGEILDRAGPLPAALAAGGEAIRPGRIYVAPPDRHLLVARDDRVALSRGPRENRARPAIDALFRSAAAVGGPRVIGVILTGYLDDGAAGLQAIQAAGGLTVVQDPADAAAPEMPGNALAAVAADHVRPLAELPPLLAELCREPLPAMVQACGVEAPRSGPESGGRTMEATRLTCPDCGGVLSEEATGAGRRYVCYLGHAYSPHTLDDAQAESVEDALWHAVRRLEEQAMLSRRLAAVVRPAPMPDFARELERKAEWAERDAQVIRRMLERAPEKAKATPSSQPSGR
jgi:two-component system chemotaxis response regulator CheB